MIYYVKASQNVGRDPQTFRSVVEAARQAEGKPPPEIIFSGLPSGGTTVDVRETEGATVQLGADQYTVRAVGISSCAAVCFLYEDEYKELHAYLYHANTGKVPWEKFLEIMKEIGAEESRYKRVQVLYVHPGAADKYHQYADELERWLRSAVVVDVSHLPGQIFAMNQGTVVGY